MSHSASSKVNSSNRRILLVVVASFLAILLVAIALVATRPGSVKATSTSTSPSVKTILIVGVDSREIAAQNPTAQNKRIFPDARSIKGERADVIIAIRTDGKSTKVMAISRDLLSFSDNGLLDRLAIQWSKSPQSLVRALCRVGRGIPVDNVVAVDYRALIRTVDAAGGFSISTPRSIRDKKSHLNPTRVGENVLDGEQALAWVRARHIEELINGKWKPKTSPESQRSVRAAAVVKSVSSTSMWRWPNLASSLPQTLSAVRLDQKFGIGSFITLLKESPKFTDVEELNVRLRNGKIPFAYLTPKGEKQIREFTLGDRCRAGARNISGG